MIFLAWILLIFVARDGREESVKVLGREKQSRIMEESKGPHHPSQAKKTPENLTFLLERVCTHQKISHSPASQCRSER